MKPEKNSGLNGHQTHDLYDTGAALLPTDLSSQLGAGHLWVRNAPVDGEDMKRIYDIHIFELQKWHFKQMIDHRSYVLNLSSWENKPEKNSGLNGVRTHDLCDAGAALLPTELSSQLGDSFWLS